MTKYRLRPLNAYAKLYVPVSDPGQAALWLILPKGADESVTALGRAATNQGYQYPNSANSISKNHCIINAKVVQGAHELYVTDMSSNGTYINGERIGKGNRKRISPGDTFQMACPPQENLEYILEAVDDGQGQDGKPDLLLNRMERGAQSISGRGISEERGVKRKLNDSSSIRDADFQAQIQLLREQAAQAQSDLKRQLQEKMAEVRGFEARAGTLQEQVAEAELATTKARREAEEFKELAAEAQQRIALLEAEVESAGQAKKHVEEDLATVKQELEAAKDEMNQQRSNFNLAAEKLERTQSNHREQLQKLQGQLQEEQQKHKAAREALAARDREVAKLKAAVKDETVRCEKAQQKCQELTQEVNDERNKRRAAEAQLSEFTAEREKRQVAEEELESLRRKIEAQRRELAEMRQAGERDQLLLADLRTVLVHFVSRIDSCAQHLPDHTPFSNEQLPLGSLPAPGGMRGATQQALPDTAGPGPLLGTMLATTQCATPGTVGRSGPAHSDATQPVEKMQDLHDTDNDDECSRSTQGEGVEDDVESATQPDGPLGAQKEGTACVGSSQQNGWSQEPHDALMVEATLQ